MNVHLPTLGDLPRLRDDVQISPFQQNASSTPKFVVQANASSFVVNSEMRDFLEVLAGHPSNFSEFAESLGNRTGKTVTVETLRTVLGRLSPALFQGQGEYKIQTPFIFNFELVPPRFLRLITARLTWLFSLPIAVIGVLAFLFMEYQIFHISDYHMVPGQTYWIRFFMVYSGVALGGLIHEVGHLTACARHKAAHGGIGLGLYLIFPAFYADVTKAWCLPKSARIAVDLGGLYFQSLFLIAVGVMALRTHNMVFFQLNFFTLVIMIFTLNPALKFDGYWLLVDASGIHNLYPRMSAMIRALFSKKVTSEHEADVTDEARIFVGLYAVLVVIFSVLLAALVGYSSYHVARGYPAKFSTAIHALSQALAVGNVKDALKTIGSLLVDSFWFVIVATFVFDFTRKTVRMSAKA
jgi:putative peptide zinc metalloprotease protein